MQDGKKILQQILAGMKVHTVAELHSREVALQVMGVCTRSCAHMLRNMQPQFISQFILFISEGSAFVDAFT
jgi:hypothetical protein